MVVGQAMGTTVGGAWDGEGEVRDFSANNDCVKLGLNCMKIIHL